MSLALLRYGSAFVAGVFAMWLWHNAAINRIEKNEAKQVAAQAGQLAHTAINDSQQAGDNSAQYLDQISKKDAAIDDLRRRLDDGSVRLRLCGAERQTAGIQADNARAAADEAGANLARYREDAIRLSERGREVDAWVESCHAWVNR